MEAFNQALDDCGLFDLGMRGRRFTWEKGRGTANWVEERLDRAVAGADWCDLFPHASVHNHWCDWSDHSAIFVEIHGLRQARQRRRFLFENAWLAEAGCKDIVLNAWNVTAGDSVPTRLSYCGDSLYVWGGDFAKKTEREIRQLHGRLNMIRDRRDEPSLAEVRLLDTNIRNLNDQLNTYWRQRAKQHWLLGGDRNTKYFHAYASARRKKNLITKLKDESNLWVEGNHLIPLAARYFQSIFTSKGVDLGTSLDSFTAKISQEDNHCLLRAFTVDDVREALFSMSPDKSPGPDGFNPAFFQHFWSEIGPDISAFILNLLTTGDDFPVGFNDAYVTLIPKKSSPTTMGDLRPIALCNVIYKVLSKMLANRLKEVLDKVISPSQSAFLPGRLITDNALIASEVIHYLNRKRQGIDGWCALKLDVAKAYDKMEWEFLQAIMSRMGFDDRWTQLIMRCVTTARYKINVNGMLTDYIVPTCGLRQGDPLSPYLFILCAEALSHLLSESVDKRMITPCIVARGAPGISHLFFADDSLLFFKATMQEAVNVKECLVSYERMSGQAVNFNKSCILFSRNTNDLSRIAVAGVFNVAQVNNIGRYLGLPMGVGRNKKEVFSYIESKVLQRLNAWNKKVLSRAGKEILLKTVAQALPTYTMSMYLLPSTFCERLERLMNKFWWVSNNNNGGGIRWLAWNKMCYPKVQGGLGFKGLSKFNLALLAKQGWRLLTQPSSLAARIIKARYYPQSDFLEAKIGANQSYSWRSVLAGQEVLKRGCVRRIGNGLETSVWKQPWLPNAQNPYVETPANNNDQHMKVSALIDSDSNEWNSQLVNSVFCPRDAALILKIPIATQFEDMWSWQGDLRGQYSVKLGYKLLADQIGSSNLIHPCWKNIWRAKVPPCVKNFLWRCLQGVIPTLVALQSRGVKIEVICPLCRQSPETLHHILCKCSETIPLWQNLAVTLPDLSEDFAAWFIGCLSNPDTSVTLKCIAIWWSIWQGRNAVVWSRKVRQPAQVHAKVARLLHEWAQMAEFEVGGVDGQPSEHTDQGLSIDSLHIFVDAAVFPESHEASYGIFIKYSNGVFFGAGHGPMNCLDDAHLAESMAIKEALLWAKDLNLTKVIVFSDCQTVCNFFKSSLPDFTYTGCILNKCREIQRDFDSMSLCFVPRSLNIVAHTLARAARSYSGPLTYFNSTPQCIEHLI
ncbi:PREDICTED: uncharacterized protein LOC109159890 [Ipomoea nil]|uniref:uncharacterized protein LOC109159890 n=1 Tax=Ipomoea nil TaxID=35883 RepID=UPI0009018825|nr:PREDICTED: uncharacterized protein LOC109159890 [Ipomoea nil]